jgi:hypothetical protein
MKIEDMYPGMKIRRTGSDFAYCKKGEIYTVHKTNGTKCVEIVEDMARFYEATNFEPVVEFDMHKNPWFIRINNLQEFNVTQQWLEANFGCNLRCNYYGTYIAFLTNKMEPGVCGSRVLWSSGEPEGKEIKLSFQTIIDKVEWPVVESATQIKIRELEESAKKLQEQIAEIKTLSKGE